MTAADIARSVVAATSSSRFVVPNYWPDPKTGIGYQVQVEIPYQIMDTLETHRDACRFRDPAWTGRSFSAMWRRSARGRCRASTTATT